MTDKQTEALKLALEFFEQGNFAYPTSLADAIREALADQPAQELLAWKNAAIRVGEELSSVGPNGYYNMTADQWLAWVMDQQPRGKNSLAEQSAQQQEPVAKPKLIGWRTENFLWETDDIKKAQNWEPNIGVLPIFEGDPNTQLTPPASKPWVGLTLDDREKLRDKYEDWNYPSVLLSEVDNILREKNA